MTYYNQRNYPNTPYPSSANPKATIKSGGCGVCATSMVLESMTTYKLPPQKMAAYSIACGARTAGGTRMQTLADKLCRDYPLTCRTTSDEKALVAHLKAGGMAIALVYGSRSGWTGVFSTSGHFVAVVGLHPDGRLKVLDPNLYSGKFNTAGRRGKVELQGNVALCSVETLRNDCLWVSPRYYLFSTKEKEEEDVTEERVKELIKEALEGKDTKPSGWAAEELEKAKALGLTDGQRPQGYAKREEVAAMVLRAKEGM